MSERKQPIIPSRILSQSVRRIHLVAILAPTLLLLVTGLLGITPPASADSNLVTARPALRTVEFTGFTRPRAELRLVAEVAGRIETVSADIGQAIPADGGFARIDDTFIRLEIAATVVEAERMESQIAFARREVDRHRELVRQKNASVSQLDALEQGLRNDTYALAALRVKRRVIDERLARARVRAPAGWRVTARTIEPGQWVNEGEVVGTAADFSALLVPFALTPEQYAALQTLAARDPGLSLELFDQGIRTLARLDRANPDFDPETRKLRVDLRIDAQLASMRGGLRVGLALPLAERTGAVLLPATTLAERYEEFWLTRADGTQVQVMRLGDAGSQGPGLLRLASPQIRAGERFRLRGD